LLQSHRGIDPVTVAKSDNAFRDGTRTGHGPVALTGYYILEGLNSCAACYYFYYLFFYLQKHFGFGNFGNLSFCALNGFVYIFAAWYGGKFGERRGYFAALTFGFATMMVALLCGTRVQTISGQVVVMIIWTLGVCFTWPSLEALVTEGGPVRHLPRRIGIYNLVWAGAGALTYFAGGALFERLGEKSLFLLPAAIIGLELLLLGWLAKHRNTRDRVDSAAPILDELPSPPQLLIAPEPAVSSHTRRNFLRMAWLANPFAYVALNTIVAVIPELSKQLNLSPTLAGFFCSIWFFVRLGTFLLLWQWTAWHYHFNWLVGAFLGLTASFTVILLVSNLWVLAIAQVVFGFATGLIYYSSLFYSMDVGETKGEHGGIHEAALGLGIFLGPAVGAAALRILPEHSDSGAWAVTGLLLIGLVLLFVVKTRPEKTP
jgi:predicted MFS family arabinose efflux permease